MFCIESTFLFGFGLLLTCAKDLFAKIVELFWSITIVSNPNYFDSFWFNCCVSWVSTIVCMILIDIKNRFDAALLVLIFKKDFVKFGSTYFISVEFIWKNAANSFLWNWFKWWFHWLSIDFFYPQLAIKNVWQIPHILLRFHLWQFTYQFWFDLLIAWVVCICLIHLY